MHLVIVDYVEEFAVYTVVTNLNRAVYWCSLPCQLINKCQLARQIHLTYGNERTYGSLFKLKIIATL